MKTYRPIQVPGSLAQMAYNAEQVRRLEPIAAKLSATSMYQLMENAGAAAFATLRDKWPEQKSIAVITGSGNNGGDGYVLARLAKNEGYTVSLYSVDPNKTLTDDAATARKLWIENGGDVSSWQQANWQKYGVIIDALLGTGIDSQLKASYEQIISDINLSQVPVLSIDIPSGLNADTGAPQPIAIKASATITFVAIKSGLVTGQGKSHCGELILNGLGIEQAFAAQEKPQQYLLTKELFSPIPKRRVHSHKGSHGRLLCLGGSTGMPGAIRLCAEAALRCGAGLVKVFCAPCNENAVLAGRPELMVHSDMAQLESLLHWADTIAIGPGLGQGEWGQNLLTVSLQHCYTNNKPMVIDADGLNLLAGINIQTLPEKLVLTPHPGEAGKLLACETDDIELNRYLAAKQISERYQACCVLKGAGSIVQFDNTTWVNQSGNPGMASPGMGDVLTGVIASLVTQGMAIDQASLFGTAIHGYAGDMTAEKYGQRGILASDLFPHLQLLVNL